MTLDYCTWRPLDPLLAILAVGEIFLKKEKKSQEGRKDAF